MQFQLKTTFVDGKVYVDGDNFLKILQAVNDIFMLSGEDKEELKRIKNDFIIMEERYAKNNQENTRKSISKVKKVS